MKYRYYRVTALVAVAQYEAEDMCDDHAGLVLERTALDAVELLNDSDDYLLELDEEELMMVPATLDNIIRLTNKGDKK